MEFYDDLNSTNPALKTPIDVWLTSDCEWLTESQSDSDSESEVVESNSKSRRLTLTWSWTWRWNLNRYHIEVLDDVFHNWNW